MLQGRFGFSVLGGIESSVEKLGDLLHLGRHFEEFAWITSRAWVKVMEAGAGMVDVVDFSWLRDNAG